MRLFDVGWSDESKCQACHKEEGTENHRPYHCPEWDEVRRGIPEAFRKSEQKARTSKKEWKWQRGIVTHPLCESQWNLGHFSMKQWESEKHRSWGMPAEGNKGHVATGGSLLGAAGKWGAVVGRWCKWILKNQDLGTVRAELMAFLCLIKKVIGSIKVHVRQHEIMMDYGEEKENASIRKLAMLTCGSRSGKSCIF